MKGCTCEPGKCKCKPKPGYPKQIDEADMSRRGFLKGLGAAAVAGAAGYQLGKNTNTLPTDIPNNPKINYLLGYLLVTVPANNPKRKELEKLEERIIVELKLMNQRDLDLWDDAYVKGGKSGEADLKSVLRFNNIGPTDGWTPKVLKELDDFSVPYFEKLNSLLKQTKESVNQGVAEGENWSKHNHKRVGGMSDKSVKSYRRSHPGSKIQTAVTKKPSKIKKGSKDAKRRASFCARMRGMKKHNTSAKTARDPNSNINKSLRRWHCESIEQMQELVMLAEQFLRKAKF